MQASSQSLLCNDNFILYFILIQIELKLLQESQAKTKEMEKLSQVLDKKGMNQNPTFASLCRLELKETTFREEYSLLHMGIALQPLCIRP